MSWRRILLLSLVLVVALVGATWIVLQRSDAATQIVRRELQALFRTATSVESTELDVGLGRLTARGVRIGDPTRAGAALLAVDRVDLDVAIASGSEFVGVHAVTVDGFVLAGGPTLPALADLLAPRPEASGATGRLPVVALRNGRVRATLRAGQAPVDLDAVALELRPRPDAPGFAIGGGAELAEAGAHIEFGGQLDPATGAATFVATLTGARLDDARIARVAALLGAEAPACEAGATVRTLRFVATLAPAPAATPPRLELAGELADVHVKGEHVPAIVTAGEVQLQVSNRDGGCATVRLQQRTANGALDVVAKGAALLATPQVDVRVHGDDIAIDNAVIEALGLFDTGRDLVAALQPTCGRADLDLFLRDPHRRGGIAELDLLLRDVAMSFHGFRRDEEGAAFPLPLEKARGRVRLRNDVVLIEDVHAEIAERAGGGTVRMLGRVDGNQKGGEDAALDIHAENVSFSRDLRRALARLLHDGGALYDRFAPQGRTEVDVLVRPQSELRGGWSVDVRPNAASMQWAGFPYRLGELRGSVHTCEDGVTFDLRGKHGVGALAMRGFIPLGETHEESRGFVANVELDNITIDDDLRRAVAVIAPGLEEPWRTSAPTGSVTGKVRVWRPRPQDPLQHDARLELTGVDLALPSAPWRAQALHGQVLVQGLGTSTRVDFDALRGELDHGSGAPAKLAMLGNLVVGDDAGEELSFVVRDLELDEQLGRTLEELQALGPGTWQSLRPSGPVDLVAHHRRRGAVAEPLHLVVHLLDVRSDAPMLPRPAEHMTGELMVAGGELRFDDVRAVLGGAQVTATAGRVRERPAPDSRTEISFGVSAMGVPVDDGIANLFSGPLHTTVLRRQLLGRTDVDALRLVFAVPTGRGNPSFETTLEGQLRLYDLSMTLGTGIDGFYVEGINGVVSLAQSTVSDTGGALRGALTGTSIALFDQPIEKIEATFLADANRIAVGSLRAALHGGALANAHSDAPGIEYLLPGPRAPEGRLMADLTFENVDVYTLLEYGGWLNPPYRGIAKGTLVIERLDGSSMLGAVGHGVVALDRADLGVVPLFTAIYAQLPASDRPRFDGLDVTWKVQNRGVEFERFDVHSSILSARGKGRMSFDGYLSVEMSLSKLLGAAADPFVMPLLTALAGQVVTFYLDGYLRDLHAEKRWFSESQPRRREVLPMPPAQPQMTVPKY
jgi:hypothetical protein